MSKNNMFNQKLEQIGGENIVDGITLKSEDKEKILNFINANTNQNYILNDNKLEKEKNEQEIKNTLLDEEIDCAIKENRKILIALSENVENVIEMYISEDNTERLILIDKDFCEKDNLEDIALADRLTKALFITHENDGIALLSSTAIKAVIGTSSNVYHGPDSSNYAKVGSIDAGEDPVYILAVSMGWYHIEYVVTSTGKHKTGYIPADVVTSRTEGTLSTEDFYGGYCYATTELDVRTCDDFSLTAPVGTLYKNEGCTFLFSYEFNGNNIAFIEYATSSGTKRGYVYAKYLKFTCETIVCIAKENIPVYGGPSDTTYAHFGTIYKDELMSLLAKEGNWIYVEYNTTKGRKRGYVDWSKVNPRDYTPGTVFNDFYIKPENANCHIIDESVPVYGGPSTAYAKIGSVNYENITAFWTNNSTYSLTCIEYVVTSTGLLKRGYIDPSKIITGFLAQENNAIESFENSYANFGNKIVYGKTQLGKDMFYYKAGSGTKHIFLVYAQHGWEDGVTSSGSYKHGDGNVLLKMAKNFITRFNAMLLVNRTKILNNWTIYLFPGINLDGIVNGYSNSGFGRCFYNGIDPNRSYPGNFKVFTTARNKTGPSYLGAQELVNLKNVLMNNISSDENVLIDLHGWENSCITNDDALASYFLPQLKELNSSCIRKKIGSANGYLVKWAANSKNLSTTSTNMAGLGARTALIEFPPTTNYSDNNINNYGEKAFNAITKFLLSESTTSGSIKPNILLCSKLHELYDLASKWNDSNDVSENNKLVLDYLRYEKYSGGDTYDPNIKKIPFDMISRSIAKSGFYKYVCSVQVQDLSINNFKVHIDSIDQDIGLDHWAVTALTIMNNTDPYYKDLNGWAGDLIQLAGICQNKYNSNSNDYNYTERQLVNLIGCTDSQAIALGFKNASVTGFSREDLYQDIDAVNLAEKLKSQPIYTVFNDYYVEKGDTTRVSQFVKNLINSSTKCSFLGSVTDADKLVKIASQYTNRELKDAYLLDIFCAVFGGFSTNLWGGKLAHAFKDKILTLQ